MRGRFTMLLLALVVLVSFDAWLRYHRATDRLADSVLRPLVDPAREIVPERIRAVRLRAPGAKGEWRYERRGDRGAALEGIPFDLGQPGR